MGPRGGTLALLAALLGAGGAEAADSSPPVRISCPIHQTTTVVFPEPLRQLRTPGEQTASLSLTVRSTRPRGVITVRPTAHPAERTVEFRGPTLVLRVILATTPDGEGTEVEVGRDGTLTAPAPPPVTPPAAAPPPPVAAAPPPSVAPASPTLAALDMEGLLRARPVAIDRKEGRPGQRAMILVDALHGDEWIWLRFRLEGGASERVERVWWEHGEITRVLQEPSGRDLRLVAQVPRSAITRKTRISVTLAGGVTYKFPLSPSTLTNFVKELFSR